MKKGAKGNMMRPDEPAMRRGKKTRLKQMKGKQDTGADNQEDETQGTKTEPNKTSTDFQNKTGSTKTRDKVHKKQRKIPQNTQLTPRP